MARSIGGNVDKVSACVSMQAAVSVRARYDAAGKLVEAHWSVPGLKGFVTPSGGTGKAALVTAECVKAGLLHATAAAVTKAADACDRAVIWTPDKTGGRVAETAIVGDAFYGPATDKNLRPLLGFNFTGIGASVKGCTAETPLVQAMLAVKLAHPDFHAAKLAEAGGAVNGNGSGAAFRV